MRNHCHYDQSDDFQELQPSDVSLGGFFFAITLGKEQAIQTALYPIADLLMLLRLFAAPNPAIY
jgi:hypothetical protein